MQSMLEYMSELEHLTTTAGVRVYELVSGQVHCEWRVLKRIALALYTRGAFTFQEICTVQPVHVPVPSLASVAFPSFSVLRTPSQQPPGGCPLHPECCPEPWPVPGH